MVFQVDKEALANLRKTTEQSKESEPAAVYNRKDSLRRSLLSLKSNPEIKELMDIRHKHLGSSVAFIDISYNERNRWNSIKISRDENGEIDVKFIKHEYKVDTRERPTDVKTFINRCLEAETKDFVTPKDVERVREKITSGIKKFVRQMEAQIRSQATKSR